MRKKNSWPVFILCSLFLLLGMACHILAESKGFIPLDLKQNLSNLPEFILFEKTGNMGKVNFDLAAHMEVNSCKDCHGGAKPIFSQSRSKAGFKMEDFSNGKYCGACHDGKKAFSGKENCEKCHNS